MKYNNLVLTAGLAALLVTGAACSKETSERSPVSSGGDGKGMAPASAEVKRQDQALVRFVNATPSSKDLAFGDTIPFSNVGAKDVTQYKTLPAERHDFKLLLDGNKERAFATNNESLTAGKHYTVLAVTQKDGTFMLDPVADDLTPPSTGKAKVRVINLAAGVKNVDLYVTSKNSAIISGAGLDNATAYKEVAPADGTLDVRNSMSKKDDQVVKDVQMEAGKLYTILVFQDQSGKLKIKTVEDVFSNES